MRHNPKQQKQWIQILSEFKERKGTITNFCKTNNLKVHQFYYWRKKLENKIVPNKSSFIKVNTIDTIPKLESFFIELSGIKISVPPNFNPIALAKLLKVVTTID